MMNVLKAAAIALMVVCLPIADAAIAASDPSAERIDSFYASLLDTMKHGHSLGIHGRYDALAPAVDATFDLTTMIKFIAGASWSSMSDSDHKALVEAFRRMTIANYASNFNDFNGQRFQVEPNVQTRGSDHFVSTTLTTADGKAIPMIYRMRQTAGGQWKAIDILLNGYVSELATRRSDFSSTLASGGAPALVQKLNSLADGYMKS
jgi:phospholipid transport system substrate-binding protein